MIRSRVSKLNKMGLEKTLDGKRWIAQIQEQPRIGSINANGGGWANGKRSAGRVVDAPEPPIRFTSPPCESLNVRLWRVHHRSTMAQFFSYPM